MSDDIKVALLEGGGAPPGFKWGVWVLWVADADAKEVLDENQYAHMAEQIQELARDDTPVHSSVAEVMPIEDFFELKDKGGPILGNLNVRVFFILDKEERQIVVVGVYAKQNNGKLSRYVKSRIRRRVKRYMSGYFAKPWAK